MKILGEMYLWTRKLSGSGSCCKNFLKELIQLSDGEIRHTLLISQEVVDKFFKMNFL